MRDPNRIRPFLNRLAAVWETMPDMRFAQVVAIVASTQRGNDPFFLEDDAYIDVLETWTWSNQPVYTPEAEAEILRPAADPNEDDPLLGLVENWLT